jgi:hypothetical protein
VLEWPQGLAHVAELAERRIGLLRRARRAGLRARRAPETSTDIDHEQENDDDRKRGEGCCHGRMTKRVWRFILSGSLVPLNPNGAVPN